MRSSKNVKSRNFWKTEIRRLRLGPSLVMPDVRDVACPLLLSEEIVSRGRFTGGLMFPNFSRFLDPLTPDG